MSHPSFSIHFHAYHKLNRASVNVLLAKCCRRLSLITPFAPAAGGKDPVMVIPPSAYSIAIIVMVFLVALKTSRLSIVLYKAARG